MKQWLGGRTYPVLLAMVSVGILAGGALLKPRHATPKTVVSESETARLQQLAQKRALGDTAAYFSVVTGRAGSQIVYVPEAEASGVVWSGRGEIVTSAEAAARWRRGWLVWSTWLGARRNCPRPRRACWGSA